VWSSTGGSFADPRFRDGKTSSRIFPAQGNRCAAMDDYRGFKSRQRYRRLASGVFSVIWRVGFAGARNHLDLEFAWAAA
jgi:hypothetical protein